MEEVTALPAMGEVGPLEERPDPVFEERPRQNASLLPLTERKILHPSQLEDPDLDTVNLASSRLAFSPIGRRRMQVRAVLEAVVSEVATTTLDHLSRRSLRNSRLGKEETSLRAATEVLEEQEELTRVAVAVAFLVWEELMEDKAVVEVRVYRIRRVRDQRNSLTKQRWTRRLVHRKSRGKNRRPRRRSLPRRRMEWLSLRSTS